MADGEPGDLIYAENTPFAPGTGGRVALERQILAAAAPERMSQGKEDR